LREYLGLPIESTEEMIQYNSNEVDVKKIRIYRVKDLLPFTMKQDWESKETEKEVFRVYEEIKKTEDKEFWDNIRFDLIVVSSGNLGEEFVKTIGYYRSYADNEYRYPEIYQLVEGYAEFVLQQQGENHAKIKDVIMIRTQKQDLVAIPPSYGVTIINPSQKKTILARIRAADAEELSDDYKKSRGECYYKIKAGRWEYNNNYEEIPELRLGEPQNTWKSMKKGIPIYASYMYNPKRYDSLIEPDPAEFTI
jgi:glucose-6-phosphate isomerase